MSIYITYEELDDYKCGKCRYHKKEKNTEDWICTNENSECYGCVTEYGDYCEDLEKRD